MSRKKKKLPELQKYEGFVSGDLFHLRDYHIDLITKANWQWTDGAYEGSIEISSKRPFGNSSWSQVAMDMAQICKLPVLMDKNDYDITEEMSDAYLHLYRELFVAFTIILEHRTFEPGIFRCNIGEYSWEISWERV